MKNKLKRFLFYLIQFTWGLPQNTLGFLIFMFLKIKYGELEIQHYRNSLSIKWKLKSSMSLGVFLFVSSFHNLLLKHEYGHTIQSLILGPFYLLVIGIESFLWCNLKVCREYRRKRNIKYDDFYTENWANRLSGVNKKRA